MDGIKIDNFECLFCAGDIEIRGMVEKHFYCDHCGGEVFVKRKNKLKKVA